MLNTPPWPRSDTGYFDFLFDTAEEALEFKADHYPEADLVLVRETVEVIAPAPPTED